MRDEPDQNHTEIVSSRKLIYRGSPRVSTGWTHINWPTCSVFQEPPVIRADA